MPTDTQRTIAGALLIGASVLTGNTILQTLAKEIGVKWTDAGLRVLWQQVSLPLQIDSASLHAGQRAIHWAVDYLCDIYQKQSNLWIEVSAFDLVRECAYVVGPLASYTEVVADIEVQETLDSNLDKLLSGCDKRQVGFLKARLLKAVTYRLCNELLRDNDAWRLYQRWLITHVVTYINALAEEVRVQVPQVMGWLSDQEQNTKILRVAADRLALSIIPESTESHLEGLSGNLNNSVFPSIPIEITNFMYSSLTIQTELNRLSDFFDKFSESILKDTKTMSFEKRRENYLIKIIISSIDQNTQIPIFKKVLGGIQDNISGITDISEENIIPIVNKRTSNMLKKRMGSGAAFVVNNPSPPQPPPPAESPRVDVAEPTRLTLTFTPTESGAKIRWEAHVIGVVESHFTTPYQGDDLALVVRALDVLQFSEYPNPQGEEQQAWFSFSPAEQARLADLGLWGSAGRVDAAAHRQVGRALFDALTVDPSGAQALSTARDHATTTGRRLALALRFPPDAVRLGALPWELLWATEPAPLLLSRGTLADCTRHLDLAQALPLDRPRPRTLRILAIVPYADISPAQRQIERATRQAAWQPLIQEGRVVMDEIGRATRQAVTDAIHRRPPDIIHYYGHGLYRHGQGELLFDAPDGGRSWTGGDRLMALFGGARLVVLQACQGAMVGEGGDVGLLTGIAPALSAAGVPLVVGMQLTTQVGVAVRMSTVFYRALSAGLSVQEALNQARQALYVEEEDQRSWYIPVLYICRRETGQVYV